MKSKNDSRWWEFYFVRYFVGTALGAIIILFLAASDSPTFSNHGALAEVLKSFKPDKFESGYLWLLAIVGLAYCYLASSPVLVLHATRGSLFHVRTKIKCRLIVSFATLLILVSGS